MANCVSVMKKQRLYRSVCVFVCKMCVSQFLALFFSFCPVVTLCR